MASQGFKSGNSTGLDNSDPQGAKQGKQQNSSSHKQHDADSHRPGSGPEPRYKDIAGSAQHAGDVSSHAHDIKKAERAMHDEFKEARFAAGEPTGGKGSAPGGPAHGRK